MRKAKPERTATFVFDENKGAFVELEPIRPKTRKGALAGLSKAERDHFVRERERSYWDEYLEGNFDAEENRLAYLLLRGYSLSPWHPSNYDSERTVIEITDIGTMEEAERAAKFASHPAVLEKGLAKASYTELSLTSKVLNQGGRLEFGFDEFASEEISRGVCAPLTYAFRTSADKVVVVVPNEMREPLAQDSLLPRFLESSKREYDLIRLASACCDLYGIIPAEEVLALLAERVSSPFDTQSTLETLQNRESFNERFEVFWHDGAAYLAGSQVFERIGKSWSNHSGNARRTIAHGRFAEALKRHASFPRCIPQNIPLEDFSLWKRMKGLPEYEEAQSFLDARIPYGEDEFFYADDTLRHLLSDSLDGYGIEDLMPHLEKDGVYFNTGEEYGRFFALVACLLDAIPRWECNGWCYRDVIEGAYL